MRKSMNTRWYRWCFAIRFPTLRSFFGVLKVSSDCLYHQHVSEHLAVLKSHTLTFGCLTERVALNWHLQVVLKLTPYIINIDMLGLRHDVLDPCFDIPAVTIMTGYSFAKKTSRTLTGIEPGPKMFIDVILPHVNCRAICHQFSSTKKSSCTTLSRCYLAPPQPRCDHRLARWGWSGAARRCRSPPNTAPTAGWPTSTRSSLRRFLGQNSSDSEKRQTMWILYLWKSLEC